MLGRAWLGRSGELSRGYKKVIQILRAPPKAARPTGYSAPLLPSIHPPSQAASRDCCSQRDGRKCALTSTRNSAATGRSRKCTKAQRRNGRCGGRHSRQVVTYLLHLVKRRLVHAELLEVILRCLNHLVDDLLVDITLAVAVSKPAFIL
jgi:hypothetical protein